MNRRLACGAAAVLFHVLAGRVATGAQPARPAPGRVAPVVAGYEAWGASGKARPAQLGELLLGELNCTACHAAPGAERVAPKGAPDLSRVGERMTPGAIRAYLNDPHAWKLGTTMPDIFHASEAASKAGAVEFLTHFLVSLGGPIKPATEEGNVLLVDRGRELYHAVGCVACHEPEKGYRPKPAPGVPAGTAARVEPVRDPPAAKKAGPAPEPPDSAQEFFVRSVPLGNLAAKTTVDQLTAFLLEPHESRPSGRMPASNLSTDEARAVAVYLLREQMDNPQVADAGPLKLRGLKFDYFERPFRSACGGV